MYIGTESKKVRQDDTDYKLELKVSECMLVNFKLLILILNFEFWFWIMIFDFKFRILILNFEI